MFEIRGIRGASPIRFGFNIYLYSSEQQNQFLVEALVPALNELSEKVQVWFERFDARGPHLMLLVTTSSESCTVREFLSDRFSSHLASRSELPLVDSEEIEARHAGCRGKALCSVDQEAGYGADGTFRPFDQQLTGYPFFLIDDPANADMLLEHLDLQTRWVFAALARVAPNPATVDAICWTAAVDRALASRCPAAAEYWEYHASTLKGGLAERLQEDRDAVYRALPTSIREKNVENFSRVWTATAEADDPSPGLSTLINQALARVAPNRPEWSLLREVVHTTLKQLGLPVAFHVPLLLFAWHRNLVAQGLAQPASDGTDVAAAAGDAS